MKQTTDIQLMIKSIIYGVLLRIDFKTLWRNPDTQDKCDIFLTMPLSDICDVPITPKYNIWSQKFAAYSVGHIYLFGTKSFLMPR
jgi:hypothetical protein